MAYKEVEAPPVAAGGEFFQFNAIGDKLQGIYAGSGPSTSNYAKPGDLRHNVLTREGMRTLDPAPTDAARKLKASAAAGELKPGCLIMLTFHAKLNTGKDSDMKVIKTLVDPEVTPAALEMLRKHASTKPEPRKPEPKADDPFGDDIPF